jgi:hypothetical protein
MMMGGLHFMQIGTRFAHVCKYDWMGFREAKLLFEMWVLLGKTHC